MATDGGPDHVPPAERIAVFDNDGTLWCEKPMPIELGFILTRLAEMAEARRRAARPPALAGRLRQGLRVARRAITKHYHGDDDDVKLLMGGMLQAFAGQSVEGLLARRREFLRAGSTRRSAGRSTTAATCR